ncbi:hypothetical protein DFH06DRAFT_1419059 [Mycena polygramma]|nr:hypothetical protein DFH06DRAFT_1419059 [Mycena polygramma]
MPPLQSYVDRVATEVWLNCWSFSEPAQLKALSLVCRYFKTLSQPLLFRQLTVRAPYVDPGGWIPATQTVHYADHRLTRIAASSHALSVRRWTWAGDEEMEDLPQTFPLITHIHVLRDTWRRLLATFTSTLGAYQRLTVLDLSCIEITPEFRATLETLSLLQDLTLTYCDIVGRTGSLLPLRKFSFTGTYESDYATPITLVDPERLESLALHGSSKSEDAFPDNGCILSTLLDHPLPRLTQLHFILTTKLVDLFFPLLECCPGLQSLRLISAVAPEFLPQRLSDTAIPALTSLVGPPTVARLFVCNRPVINIGSLSLWSTAPATDSDPLADTLAFLRNISCGSVPLQTLSITEPLLATHLSKLLRAVGRLFPDLRTFEMALQDVPYRRAQVSAPSDEEESEEEEEEYVDDRMVELWDGSVEYASSDSEKVVIIDHDSDLERDAVPPPPPPAPVVYLPGYMYVSSEEHAPELGELLPQPRPEGALILLFRLLHKKRITLPAQLEVLSFGYARGVELDIEHRLILALEKLCPTLRTVGLGARHSWVRTRHMWVRTAHVSRWAREPVRIVSLVCGWTSTRKNLCDNTNLSVQQ